HCNLEFLGSSDLPISVHSPVGEIIKYFEQEGFHLVTTKFFQASEEHLKQHYTDLKHHPFFPGLEKYVNPGPVVATEGLNVVENSTRDAQGGPSGAT
uniref:nucleoside-diphosphate kinase n=1 Tax=Prolemur simus TaxID=1328070 RepID=A0A8C8ZCP4_PROSS